MLRHQVLSLFVLVLSACARQPIASKPAVTAHSSVLELEFSQPGEHSLVRSLGAKTQIDIENGPAITVGTETASVVFGSAQPPEISGWQNGPSCGKVAEVFVWRGGNASALTQEIVDATKTSGWFVVSDTGFLFSESDRQISGVVSSPPGEPRPPLIAVFCA